MLEFVLMMCVFYTNYKLADESNLNPPSPVQQQGRQSQSNGHPRSQDDILSNFCLAITDIAAQHCQSITHNFIQHFMSKHNFCNCTQTISIHFEYLWYESTCFLYSIIVCVAWYVYDESVQKEGRFHFEKKNLQNTKFYDSSIYAKKRLFLKRGKNSLENLKTLIKILQIFQESEEMKLWYITIFF